MPVPELMKNAAMLIEHTVVGLDQPEKFIALEKSGAQLSADRGIIVRQPRSAVGVVIHQHHVIVGNYGGQYLQLDGDAAMLSPGFEDGLRGVRGRLGVSGNP